MMNHLRLNQVDHDILASRKMTGYRRTFFVVVSFLFCLCCSTALSFYWAQQSIWLVDVILTKQNKYKTFEIKVSFIKRKWKKFLII